MNILNVVGDTLGQVFGYLLWFFFDLFNNYAIAIVLFTIIIKVLVFPFDLKSRKANAKTSRFSAKTREIQKKYANNKQKMNEELAKLYQEEGASPMKGCMPMLFPMFAFFGVWTAIVKPLTNMFHISADKVNSAIEYLSSIPGISRTFSAQYAQLEVIKLFPSVSDKLTMFSDQEISNILDFNTGFKFLGTDLFAIPANSGFSSMVWIWPVLCAATMILSVHLGTKMGQGTDIPQQGCVKLTPYIMSIPFVLFVFYAPVALGLYYLVSNILSVVQNVIIAKFFSPSMINTKEEAARIALREIEESKVKRI